MFDTLEMSLTVLEQLAPVETKIRQRRKSLADEIGRAAESVALNVSEARQRAGLDRADLFRRAAGSASELTTALRIARARGYITPAELVAVGDARLRSRDVVAIDPLITARADLAFICVEMPGIDDSRRGIAGTGSPRDRLQWMSYFDAFFDRPRCVSPHNRP